MWIRDTHDALTARKATTAGIPFEALRDYADLWSLPKTWTTHERYETLTIDGVDYSHGETGKGGMYASVKQSRDNFRSRVCGHWHSEAGVWYSVNNTHRVFGMNVGTGIDAKLLQFEYGRNFSRKPVVGCGVVLGGQAAYFEPSP